MKKTKKVLSFLLAIVMVFAMSFTTAFAAEAPESNMEQNTHATSGDEGIMPLVWDQFSVDVPANGSVTLSGYNIYERYMAFEATATVMGGGTNSGTYSVHVQRNGASIAGIGRTIDGVMHKKDWIDFQSTNNTFGFQITNNSNVGIHVEIVYYSWS